MTINESDERVSHNLSMRDHHQESSPNLAKGSMKNGTNEESKNSLIKKSSSSEITTLRQKIKDMRDKHQNESHGQSYTALVND